MCNFQGKEPTTPPVRRSCNDSSTCVAVFGIVYGAAIG